MKTKLWLTALLTMLCCAMFAVGVSAAVWDGTAASGFAGGTGTEADPYTIATAEQLAYLAKTVNNGTTYEGQYIKLTADIELNNTASANWKQTARNWTPIGSYTSTTSNKPFKGTFDGANRMIIGLYISNSSDYRGLFGYSYNATFKNVTVVDSHISGRDSVGALVGYAEYYTGNADAVYTISNCTVNLSNVVGDNYVGGLAGKVYGYAKGYDEPPQLTVRFEGCTSKKGTVTGDMETGGILGYTSGGVNNGNVAVSLQDCTNTGKVSDSSSDSSPYVGGIVGYCDYNATVTVTDCTNSGDVSASSDSSSYYAGGIVGYCDYNATVTVTGCTNSGDVSAYFLVSSSPSAGGIVGYCEYNATVTVTDCTNSGAVSASDYAGGIVGCCNSGLTVTDCTNSGDVSSFSLYAGGIVGACGSDAATVTVTGCTNLGDVSASYGAGGVIACSMLSTTECTLIVTSCANFGNVSASSDSSTCDAGGIVGYCAQYSIYLVTNCANYGDVSASATHNIRACGIVGMRHSTATGIIRNCYNTGSAQYGIAYSIYGEIVNCYNVGTVSSKAIVGSVDGKSIVQNCYYLTGSGPNDANATALTEEQMKNPSSFAGFDFTNTWMMGGADYPYPVLRSAAAGGTTNAAAPVIYAQTSVISCPLNENVALFISADAADGGVLTYQWYASDSENGIYTAISGATRAGYTPSTAAEGTKYYYVTVTNTNTAATGAQITSVRSDIMSVTAGAQQTYTISGTLITYGDKADVTIELLQGGAVIQTVTVENAQGNVAYVIPNVESGTYTMRISKDKHVTREYEVTVGKE